MTELKRNDPCHCGSGKKYKFCCKKKDQEAERQARKERRSARAGGITPTDLWSTPDSPELPPPPDPQQEAFNALWDEFQATDYEGQIALFNDTLANKPDLMDREMVFEFFLTIYPQAVEHHERDRFEALAEALREQLPEVYVAEAGNILSYRITNALADGRYDDVPAMAAMLATNAEAHIDDFFNLLDQLAYYNQLAVLISATRLAWSQVKDSTKVFGSGELAQKVVDYIVFDYISCTAAPEGRDPVLLAQIEPYMSLNLELLSTYVAILSGRQQQAWTLDDFQFEPAREDYRDDWDDDEDDDDEAPDEGRQNLAQLSWEFLNYLFHQEQVPYAKGELARAELYRYILRRFEGKLEQDEGAMFDIFSQPKRKKQRSPKRRRQRHLLCPDRGTLDRYLGELLGFINPQYYKAVTLLELVPAWLRFLESRQLIGREQREQTLTELRGLDTELNKVVQDNPDPALLQAMTTWRDNAE